jgi:signal transduction histidine kinase
MPSPRTSGRALFATIVAIVLSFLVSTLIAQSSNRTIDRAAQSIHENATPTIRLLNNARDELREIAVELARYGNGHLVHPEHALARVREARDRLRKDVEANEALPFFPGEDRLTAEVRADMTEFDDQLDRILADIAVRGAPAALDGINQLAPMFQHLNDAMRRDVDFNAAQTIELSNMIKHVRHRTMVIEWSLDAGCVLLAVAAGLLARRSMHGYTRLLGEHSQLLERRADELELFAGRVAHDILSPLGAAKLSVDLAARRQVAPEHAQLLERATASLRRVQLMVDGLYEFARAGARPVPGAHAAVREVVMDLTDGLRPEAEAANVELSVAAGPTTGAVACSPGVLTSLLSNLLRNAFKCLASAPVKRVDVRVLDNGPSVRFEVEDTGPGLPPGLGDNVFLPYVRAAHAGEPGLGLGLATVKRIALAHGGAVGVRSAPEHGCLFWFELPRVSR